MNMKTKLFSNRATAVVLSLILVVSSFFVGTPQFSIASAENQILVSESVAEDKAPAVNETSAAKTDKVEVEKTAEVKTLPVDAETSEITVNEETAADETISDENTLAVDVVFNDNAFTKYADLAANAEPKKADEAAEEVKTEPEVTAAVSTGKTEKKLPNASGVGNKEVTIYFKNSQSWTDIRAYVENASSGNTGSWSVNEFKNLNDSHGTGDYASYHKLTATTGSDGTFKVVFINIRNSAINTQTYDIIVTDDDDGKIWKPTGYYTENSETKWAGSWYATPTLADDNTRDVSFFVQGRFSANNVTTYASNKNWSETSKNIVFTKIASNQWKYETNASIASLAGKLKENNPYFYFDAYSGSTKSTYKTNQTNDGTYSSNYNIKYDKVNGSWNSTRTDLVTSGGSDTWQNYIFDNTGNSNTDHVTLWIKYEDNKYYFGAKFKVNTFTASVDSTNTSNVSLSCDGKTGTSLSDIESGKTVTVTATLPEGKIVDTVSVTGGGTVTTLSSNVYSFVMPSSDATVTVTYKTPSQYNLKATLASASGGSIKLDDTSVTSSKTISVTEKKSAKLVAEPEEGYMVSWSVTSDSYDTVLSSFGTNSNEITIYPTADIEITANFYPIKIYLESADKFDATEDYRRSALRLRNSAGTAITKNSDVDYAFEMTLDSGTIYKLNTNCTLDDLSFQPGGGAETQRIQTVARPRFYIAKRVNSNLVASYHPKENNNDSYNSSNTRYRLDKSDYFNGKYNTYYGTSYNDYYFAFSSNDKSGKVVVWFDIATNKFWYTIEKDTTDVIAKYGTLRYYASNNNYGKYTNIAQTTLAYTYEDDGTLSSVGKTIGNTDSHYVVASPKKGKSVRVTTTLTDSTDYYYVKGFSVNGETYGLISESDARKKRDNNDYSYSFDFVIPEDENDTLEITPIFFYFTDKNTSYGYITFRVQDFTGTVKSMWDDTISCYAWYKEPYGTSATTTDLYNVSGKVQQALGGFPGQPMIKDGDEYYIQVPKSLGTGHEIMGVTLSNYIWDQVHATLYAGDTTDAVIQPMNYQTYDYDDFVALSEKDDLDAIIFRFKYRSQKNAPTQNYNIGTGKNASNNYANYDNSLGNNPDGVSTLVYSEYDSINGNGWEVHTNSKGEPIDLFNNVLTAEEAANSTKYYIVSDGYKKDYVGYYATLWTVYDSSFQKVGRLPSSALFYEPDSSYIERDGQGNITYKPLGDMPDDFMDYGNFETTTASSGEQAEYWTTFKKLWNAGAQHIPVEITFETAIYASYNDPTNPAMRNDGVWLYSKKEPIQAHLRIQYDNGNGVFQSDSFDESNNTGTTTSATVQFTNESVDMVEGDPLNISGLVDVINVTMNANESFNMKASSYVTGTDGKKYQFIGWYVEKSDGTYERVSTTPDYSVTRSKDRTLIARYVVDNGQSLTINHNLYADAPTPDPDAHNGSADSLTVSAVVKDKDGTVVARFDANGDNSAFLSSSKLTSLIEDYKEYHAANTTTNKYTVTITYTTTPSANNTFHGIYRRTDTTENQVTTYTYTEQNDETSPSPWTTSQSTTSGVTTTTYNCDFESLFNINGTTYTLKSDEINEYSDISGSTSIKITFKYYDRNTKDVQHSLPVNIDPEAKQIKVVQAIDTANGDKTLPIAIAHALYDDAKDANGKNTGVMAEVSNVIDEYYFWTTQTEANSEDGILGLKNFNTDANYTLGTYHTDHYGRQQSTGEKWVTYYNKQGVELKSSEEDILADPTLVDSVVVWAYNYPKKYDISVYMPNSVNDLNLLYTPINGVYFTNTSTVSYSGYYNQRFGGVDERYDGGVGTNVGSTYLSNYGITTPYFGHYGSKTGSPTIISAKQYLGTNNEYKFNGWYLDGVKVSNDLSYGFRVTSNNSDLKAGYVPTASWNANRTAKVSITSNGVDKYYLDYQDTRYKMYRFNYQLNVYDNFVNGVAADKEDDTNINDASMIYVRLPVSDSLTSNNWKYFVDNNPEFMSEVKDAIDNYIKTSGVPNQQIITVDFTNIDVDADLKVISYTYSIQTETKSVYEATEIRLTNKNRAQFTFPMNAAFFENNKSGNSAMLAFAAINYNGSWIVSDNCIPTIYGEAQKPD